MESQNQELETLIELYKEEKLKLPDKEKARLEEEIWVLAKGSAGLRADYNPYYRRDWLTKVFGGGPSEYDNRMYLLRVGDAAEELWERIANQSLKLGAAALLLRNAKASVHKSGKSLKGEISALLISNQDPVTAAKVVPEIVEVKELKRKKVVRKTHVDKETRQSAEIIKQSVEKSAPGVSSRQVSSREFVSKIEAVCNEFAREHLGDGVDEFIAKGIISEFVWWGRVAFDIMRQSIKQLKEDTRKDRLDKVGRTKFAVACEVLGISRAVFGKDIDLNKAKKRMFTRAAQLHPDRHNGIVSEAMKAEYDAVNSAYAILVHYTEQLQENRK